MNTIFLFFSRIKQYILKNKLIFTLFIFCGMLNTVAVVYCYGNLLPAVANQASQEVQCRKYTVLFKNTPAKLEDVERLAVDPLIEAYMLSNKNVFTYHREYPLIRLRGTLEFTGPHQVIASFATDLSVGDIYVYQNQEFQVIGIVSGIDRLYYIPLETFLTLDNAENITRIEVLAASRQDPSDDRVMALLKEIFPYCTFCGGESLQYANDEAELSESWFYIIAVNAFLAVIAHVFLLHHVLASLRNENVISIILGASKGQLATFVFGEAMTLCATSSGLGILVHILLYEPVFRQLNLSQEVQYGMGDYSLIFLLMLVLSLVAIIPVVIKAVGTTPVAARRKVT